MKSYARRRLTIRSHGQQPAHELQRPDAEDKKQHHLQNILDHINRLTSLLDDVLQINRAETIGMEFNPALMDVAALCRTLVEDTRQINPDHIVELDITGDEALVAADVKLMRQIISNLLSNAVKYSPKHSKVQVALQFEAEDISLIVKDEVVGIPPTRHPAERSSPTSRYAAGCTVSRSLHPAAPDGVQSNAFTMRA